MITLQPICFKIDNKTVFDICVFSSLKEDIPYVNIYLILIGINANLMRGRQRITRSAWEYLQNRTFPRETVAKI